MKKKVVLICSVCLSRNYNTEIDPKKQTKRLEINKYCKKCNAHTLHKQS